MLTVVLLSLGALIGLAQMSFFLWMLREGRRREDRLFRAYLERRESEASQS